MIPATYSLLTSVAAYATMIPLAGDDTDKALRFAMIVLTIIQIILGLPPAS